MIIRVPNYMLHKSKRPETLPERTTYILNDLVIKSSNNNNKFWVNIAQKKDGNIQHLEFTQTYYELFLENGIDGKTTVIKHNNGIWKDFFASKA